jgi:hypothetical protein
MIHKDFDDSSKKASLYPIIYELLILANIQTISNLFLIKITKLDFFHSIFFAVFLSFNPINDGEGSLSQFRDNIKLFET